MKKINLYRSAVAFLIIILSFNACKKDNNINNTITDTTNPTVLSGPDSVTAGAVVVIEGKGLAQIKSILFENGKVPAGFNPVFNNSGAIVFRVPDTAWAGPTNITFTNAKGAQFTFPTVVVAFPLVTSVSTTDFESGDIITIKGSNLLSVTEVALLNTAGVALGVNATIISKDNNEVQVQMPVTTATNVQLQVSNVSGKIIPQIELINLDQTYKLFTEDESNADVNGQGWEGTYSISSDEKVSGLKSVKMAISGGYGAFKPVNKHTTLLANYTTLAFWIKGGDTEKRFNVSVNSVQSQTITVPAKVWTRFTLPLSVWKSIGETELKHVVFQYLSATETPTFYFDNIILIK
jgi:hypothetical protein